MSPPRPVTIVTGGSRGIGAATVLSLAQDGHDVALIYHQDSGAAERVAGAATQCGARCLVVQADVTNEHDVERLFARRVARTDHRLRRTTLG